MVKITNRLRACLLSCVVGLTLQACYSPAHSQKYFIEASNADPALEPLYSTSLYTVYYDHALIRCVLHSTHTWGQTGGGGGGTGIGIHAFRCDPDRIRQRAQNVGVKAYAPKIVRPSQTTPSHTERPSMRTPVVVPQQKQQQAPSPPGGTPQKTPPQGNQPIIRGAQ